MEITRQLARRPYRLGLRQQLTLAFGLLSALLLLALGAQLVSLGAVARSTRAAIEVDGRLSRIAGNIAVLTLLCRRFEKDLLLTIDDVAARRDYFARWQETYAELGAAIDAFAQAAPGEPDRRQAERWQDDWRSYGRAVVLMEQRIDQGELATPQAGNAALEPLKDSIRALTDSAVEVAAEKAGAADRTGASLQADVSRAIGLGLALGGLGLAAAIGWALWFPAQLLRPVAALRQAVRRMAEGDLAARTGLSRPDELGDLAQGFDTMAAQIAARTEELAQQYARAEAARQAADEARRLADEQLVTIRGQREVIRELSVPLLPLSDRALVMPLIGALDSSRLQLSQERALDALSHAHVHYLILDVTGVPVIDTQVAHGLMQLARSTRLLGTRIIIVGVQPEVAQTLVGLGVSFDELRFQATLQEAIRTVIRRE